MLMLLLFYGGLYVLIGIIVAGVVHGVSIHKYVGSDTSMMNAIFGGCFWPIAAAIGAVVLVVLGIANVSNQISILTQKVLGRGQNRVRSI